MTYRDQLYYLDFNSVTVEYELGFENQQGQQGAATFSQKGNMVIWGKVDLQEEDNAQFFNISKSKVFLEKDNEVSISISLEQEGVDAVQELEDLFGR